MRRVGTLLALLLTGCDGCTPEEEVPTRVEAIDDAAAGLWVGQGQGPGVAEVPVLLVNEVGASVAGGELAVSSSGTLGGTTLQPDAYGWAVAEVSAELPGAYAVDASVGAFVGTGHAFITDAPDARFAFPAWLSGGQDSPLAHAGAGLVVARDNEVWWEAYDGGGAVRVLALAEPIAALRTVHLDEDGVPDLMAWAGEELVLLRGRPDGGLGFQAGWRATTGTIRAAQVGRADEDAINDVVLAVGDVNQASLVWMPGDGQGGWAAGQALDVDFGVHALTFEDLDEDGVAEVTLLTGDGITRRYEWQGDGWQSASAMDSNLGLAGGAQMIGGHDIDGDEREEVLAWGPRLDGGGPAAFVVMSNGVSGVLYHLSASLEPVELLGVALVDADLDGALDVILSTPTHLGRTVWAAESETFVVNLATIAVGAGVIDTPDLDDDGLPDVVFSAGAAVAVPMLQVLDDPETELDESAPWSPQVPFDGLFDLGLEGDPWAGDLSGDGVVDLVAFVAGGVQAFLGVAETGTAKATLRPARATSLGVGEVGVDLAVCGAEVWALTEGNGATLLHRYTLSAAGLLTEVGSGVAASGTLVACGAFDDALAVVVDADGGRTWFGGSAGTRSDQGEAGWGDAVAADRDGDGVDELAGCAAPCTAVAADFDGDGTDDLAWSDGVETTLSVAGVESALGLGGAVSAGDADGDGVADLLVQDEGVLGIWRGLGGRPGVPMLAFIARHTRGRALVGDLDGNGAPDAFWLGDDRDATDTADWTGTLLYAEAADPSSP